MEIIGHISPPEQRLPVLTMQDPLLRQPSHPVKRFDGGLGDLLDKMRHTMYHERGIGLAAVQVGVSLRAMVVDYGEGAIELINPEIVRAEGSELAWEGCLSVPGYLGEVERPAKLRVRAQDRHGDSRWLDVEGWGARVISHEMDHLDAQLFIDCSERVLASKPEAGLRLVFMGTPEFAAQSLATFLNSGMKVVGVVTAPDRPRGRGRKVQPSPVKELALAHEVPVLQPDAREAREELTQYLEWLEPDLIITAAYGQILSGSVLAVPRIGSINVHASLLPKYRGAAPIQRALFNGETETGITIYWMDEGMDHGPILLQVPLAIATTDTFGTVHDRLAEIGAQTLAQALSLIAKGEAPRIEQDHAQATFAPKIQRVDEAIDWSQSAEQIVNQVRALSPVPGAYTEWEDRSLKILAATLAAGSVDATPGTVLRVGLEGIEVASSQGVVRIEILKPAGSNAMTAGEFLNGHEVKVGDSLGHPRPRNEG